MSKPLQPGMLCLITGCLKYPDNIGREVVLERVIQPKERAINPDDEHPYRFGGECAMWIVRADGLMRTNNRLGRVKGSFSFVCAWHLMPLEGGEDLQETEQEDRLFPLQDILGRVHWIRG